NSRKETRASRNDLTLAHYGKWVLWDSSCIAKPGPKKRDRAMRSAIACCLVVFIVAIPVGASEPKGKVVRETWDAAYLEGGKAGYVHTTTTEIDRDGRTVLHTLTELSLTVRRYG